MDTQAIIDRFVAEKQYIETVTEIAIHNRLWAAYLYDNAPVEIHNHCPCKWCREQRKSSAGD